MTKPIRQEARDQLLGYLINVRQSQQETREWIETWLDAHCPRKTIEELIEASSLGTPAAKALRARTPKALTDKVLKKARSLSSKRPTKARKASK